MTDRLSRHSSTMFLTRRSTTSLSARPTTTTCCWHRTMNRYLRPELATITGLVLLVVASLVSCHQQLDSELALLSSAAGASQHQQQQQQQFDQVHQNSHEILVSPYTQVKIECKLPPMTSANGGASQKYSWIFQRSTSQAKRPQILSHGEHIWITEAAGLQIYLDRASNSYNLLINNVTYENHDGLYFCEFQDSETNKQISHEYRLTVLSK